MNFNQLKVRFQRAERQQIEWKPLSLDQMIPEDGMRVKASAGSSSFRRKPTLGKCLKTAEEHLEELNKEEAGERRLRSRF